MGEYFGSRLREHRDALGILAGTVAEALGLHKSNYSDIERGKRDPKEQILQDLSSFAALGLTYDELKTWADLDKLGETGIRRLKTYARGVLESVHADTDGPITREWFGNVPHPPTDEELGTMNRARDAGLTYPLVYEPGFFSKSPTQRRQTFLLLECLLDQALQSTTESHQALKTAGTT